MEKAFECPLDHVPITTVLVVEDQALIRMAIAEDLRACGFEVREADSAPSAIKVLEHDTEIDVVFCDIHMPGYINGLGLARWIFACKPHVNVVLTSAAWSASDLPEELRHCVPLVAKPYDLSTVLRQLRLCQQQISRRNLARSGQRGQHLQLIGRNACAVSAR